MKIQIERKDINGVWRDEGQSALWNFKAAHDIDPIRGLQMDTSLVFTGSYEGGGFRLSRVTL